MKRVRVPVPHRAVLLGSSLTLAGIACGTGVDPSEPIGRQEEPLESREVLTQHNDVGRTGAILSETILTPATVRPDRFDQRYSRRVDGQIYAQPLYAEGVATSLGARSLVFAATMQNTVYAFDAASTSTVPTSGVVWSRTLAAPAPTPPNGGFLKGAPAMGIMSTPVIDRANNKMYVVTAEPSGAGRLFRLRAIDIRNGDPIASVVIGGSVVRDGFTTTPFDANRQIQRAALLLQGGRVTIAFAGFEDAPPYHGWVFGYPSEGLSASSVPSVYCTTPDRSTGVRRGGGIWQSGNGPAADASGNVYFTTGNGVPGGAGNAPVAEEDSFVRLGTPALNLLGHWAPPNFKIIEDLDMDLGSGGALVVPGSPERILGGGKTGVYYVHDQTLHLVQAVQAFDNVYAPVSGSSAVVGGVSIPTNYDGVGMFAAPNLHGSPVFWRGPGGVGRVYAWSEKDALKAYTMNAAGTLDPTPLVGSIFANHGMPGGTLSISANGDTNGIVWGSIPEPREGFCAVTPVDPARTCDASQDVASGRLYAFDAQTLATLWTSGPIPLYAKFTPPTIAAGKVYMATFENELRVYGPRATWSPTWQYLDGATIEPNARPSVVAASGRMDVFAKRASDASLVHKTWDGTSWLAGWEPLGGILTSNPSAVAGDVFVRDLSNGVAYRAPSSGGGWLPWNTTAAGPRYLGGIITADPAATSWGAGRIDLVARASDGTLAHILNDGAWRSWVTSSSASPAPALGHALAAGARPVIVSWGPGRLDVFARGATQSLLHFGYDGTTWAFDDLGGILTSDPAAVSWGPGRLDVFVQAHDHTLAHIAFDGHWSAWEAVPFAGLHMKDGSAPAAVSLGSNALDVFVRAVDDSLHHIAWTGATWTWWENLGGILTSEPVVAKSARGAEVFVRALDGRIANLVHPGGIL